MTSSASGFAGDGPLGTSREIAIDPKVHRDIAAIPLQERELILTFDDGPAPPCTETILDILASEQVKATFFLVGCRALRFPALVKRAAREGHTIGTHTQWHQCIPTLAIDAQQREIDEGIKSVTEALGREGAVAPFFRFPYLQSSVETAAYLTAREFVIWSMDIDTEDWMNTSAERLLTQALDRVERKQKGVILMHDIEPKATLALPKLLRELKRRNFRIVHAVPISSSRPN
jgi:peptidoglycan/xylan/chitin deacetylase (PgdA/CDA1 family)